MQDSFPSKNISSENLGNEEIISLLKNLERRISKIEKYLDLETESKTEIVTKANAVNIEVQNKEEELEYKIGQFWLAKAGIIVLIIGIAFFLTFPYKNLPLFFPPIMGLHDLCCHLWIFNLLQKKLFLYMRILIRWKFNTVIFYNIKTSLF